MSELNLPQTASQGAEAQTQGANVAVEPSDDGGVSTSFAVVNADGTLARGRSAVSAARLGTGQYEVVFRRNVRSARTSAPWAVRFRGLVSPRGDHRRGTFWQRPRRLRHDI